MTEVTATLWKQVKGRALYEVWIGDKRSICFGDDPRQSEAVKAAIAACDVALLQSERTEQMGDYVHRHITVIFPVAQSDERKSWKLCRRLLEHGGQMREFQLLNPHRATFVEESRLPELET